MLSRNGWSKAQFFALPTEEQNRWLDWEETRLKHIKRVMDVVFGKEKVYSDSVTAQALLALLNYG